MRQFNLANLDVYLAPFIPILGPGIYLLAVQTQNGTVTARFVRK